MADRLDQLRSTKIPEPDWQAVPFFSGYGMELLLRGENHFLLAYIANAAASAEIESNLTNSFSTESSETCISKQTKNKRTEQ